MFKEELMPILYKLFQEIKEQSTFFTLFYETSITLMSKPNKDITRKESYRSTYFMNIDKKSSRKCKQVYKIKHKKK